MKSGWQRIGLAAVFALATGWMVGARATMSTAAKPLAHMVFFTLKEHTPEARAEFVKSCQKYLNGHQGVLHFSVGTIAEDVVEPAVSVRDFDVALHLIFDSKESEAKYLTDPRHTEFVEANREKFAQVRVFDTYIAAE